MSVKEIFENMEYGPAPESNQEVIDFLDYHKRSFELYINGKWTKAASGKLFESMNPATGETLASISEANESDVNKAVKAAKAAHKNWVEIGAHQRARYLYAIARQIQKHSRLFAVLESMDNGKPIRESRDIDVPLVARHFYHHAGWAQLMDTDMKDYESIGVVGQIIPWNFPLLMLAWKIAPALAMGNTVVLKPAEFTSLTALLFAEICQKVNLPAGVVNIITGAGETGAAIVNHPDIAKIAFTGSTEVGKIIRKAIAGTGKKISLELGGKSPFIVFEDADLDSVVEGVVDAIWFNQGQVCCAGSRLLVQESIAEKLYSKIRARLETLRIGNSLDKCIDMGAIVAPVQLKVIQELVQKGKTEGNEFWQPSWPCPQEGCFYPPTLFTGVAPSSTIAQEEIFGPVLVAMSFRSHQEAVKLANNTRYGLAASIWTENITLALDIAPQVKAGSVWINCTNVFDAAAGFGGYRESGFGREGGKEGLYEYVKAKSEKRLTKSPQKLKTVAVKTTEQRLPNIDRTPKLFIGGKQMRPDGGHSYDVLDPNGFLIGEAPKGNRKDIRNAVEAAHNMSSWTQMTGHARAQILFYLAENMATRAKEFSSRLISMTHQSQQDADAEVNASIRRLYYYAAMADKYDGLVHHTTKRNVTIAMPERIGVLGVVCPDECPLLGFVSTVVPLISMGNQVVAIPSEKHPFSATDFYQIMETSDVPAGAINIVTGYKDELTDVLAKHDNVDGLWYFGTQEGSRNVELLSTDNLKRTWVNYGLHRDWHDDELGQGSEFLRRSVEIKNIWIPYGA
jgi:aldehyde dehydrogenase (NAD+)